MTRFTLALALAITAFLPSLANQADAKNIKRGCNGTIAMNSHPTGGVILAEMDASGFCKNKRKANDCRRQARAMLDTCAKTLWDERWDHTIPQACKTKPQDPRRGMNNFRWSQILVGLPHGTDSLKDRVEHNVCCLGNRQTGNFQAKIRWTTSGNDGCRPKSGNFVGIGGGPLSNTYTVRCTELRAAGLCGG